MKIYCFRYANLPESNLGWIWLVNYFFTEEGLTIYSKLHVRKLHSELEDFLTNSLLL